jgi:uncharacterized protein
LYLELNTGFSGINKYKSGFLEIIYFILSFFYKSYLHSPLTTGSACGEYCIIWLGPEFPTDQRGDDAASLTLNTPPLDASLAIVGATTLKLRVRSRDSKHAQMTVRLNDVAPDGASTRITYGVVNLNSEKKLRIGEWLNVHIQLDDVGYSVPVGHQLRVAISSAYFPLIWPSKDHAKLDIDLNESTITLPLHNLQTIANDTLFDEPESAPPLKLHYEREPSNTRQVIHDAMTGRVTTEIRDDFGRCINLSHGLIVEEVCEETYTILPKDPFSASSKQRWTYKAGRGNEWNVEVKSELMLMARNAEFFEIKAEQIAWENGVQVHVRKWSENVPRITI